VSGANIAVWFLLYHYIQETRAEPLRSTSEIELMLFLSAAYVFGCAFRSFLPRADIQRICLFNTWLSSATVGRSVATVAESCFAAQWAIVLYQLGTMTGNVRSASAADIGERPINVRFTPKSGHCGARLACPLCAKSGHNGASEAEPGGLFFRGDHGGGAYIARPDCYVVGTQTVIRSVWPNPLE
jgi:hypothetical protein